jgi:hypothetical protein
MATVIPTPSAEDFLALVPRLVGFAPTESIVLVAFRGTRTCAAIRLDLPADAPGDVLRRIATSMVGMFSKLGSADAVVPVVYTGECFHTSSSSPPHAEFVRVALDRFRFSGFVVRDALCVASDAWGSYLDPDAPPGGRPLDEIASSPVHAAIPGAVRDRMGDLDAWAALPVVDLVTRERVARRLRALGEALGRVGPHGPVDSAASGGAMGRCASVEAVRTGGDAWLQLALWMLDDLPMFAEDCLEQAHASDASRLDDDATALLIHVVQSPALRDVLMLQWAFDLETGDRVLEDARRFAAGAPVRSLESGTMMLGEGERPDAHRIERAVLLVKRLAAVAPRAARPPLLCMLAWFNWALGRSSVVDRFLQRAEQIDQGYGLAEVMRTVLDRGMLPEWAFRLPDDDRDATAS